MIKQFDWDLGCNLDRQYANQTSAFAAHHSIQGDYMISHAERADLGTSIAYSWMNWYGRLSRKHKYQQPKNWLSYLEPWEEAGRSDARPLDMWQAARMGRHCFQYFCSIPIEETAENAEAAATKTAINNTRKYACLTTMHHFMPIAIGVLFCLALHPILLPLPLWWVSWMTYHWVEPLSTMSSDLDLFRRKRPKIGLDKCEVISKDSLLASLQCFRPTPFSWALH